MIVGEKKMIKILSDSTCDLSKELAQRYNIGIIPLYVRLGDEEYLDGVNITPEQISNARRHKKKEAITLPFLVARGGLEES